MNLRVSSDFITRIECACFVFIIASLLTASGGLLAQKMDIDISGAVLVTGSGITLREEQAATMLLDEIEKRTLIRWDVVQSLPEISSARSAVIIAKEERLRAISPELYERYGSRAVEEAEGFRIIAERRGENGGYILILGADARGVLFGAGRLLREIGMERNRITIPAGFFLQSAPALPLRGHQLGYRPKTNSYDAWDFDTWEQYVRDLIVFGTNAIELIPPRSDDDADSPHFPIPPMDMMIKMSEMLDRYGLDVWIWYPALDEDYSKPETAEFALREWAGVFSKLKRIDAVFVPGGDPGHTHPKYLMPFLKKQKENLNRYHPEAEMWVAPQGFTAEWMEEFIMIIRREDTKSWLDGIVFGPQVRTPLDELRRIVPAVYPIRRYPDITHSIHSQYPVQDWDLAYALTESREVINPRPLAQRAIFKRYEDYAVGFITYSEGCNDDVNKIIWSSLGWDPRADVKEILRQYSRYFIGERYTEPFAEGLMALERNWRAPLIANETVNTTIMKFMQMERAASPGELLNWRFQQALYRAYYDAYVRNRLVYETNIEDRAMDALRGTPAAGSLPALLRAESILNEAVINKPAPDLRARVFELAEALYQSIRMQLSVERYKAIGVRRGANLDEIDVPLNNLLWLRARFGEVRAIKTEQERLSAIEGIVNWTNPGPGGFYDDLGDVGNQPHLVCSVAYADDPDFRKSPLIGFRNEPGWRLSWCRQAETLYDAPLSLAYEGLDSGAEYKVRVVYAGDTPTIEMRLIADSEFIVHPFTPKVNPVRPEEFSIPRDATRDGKLTLTWNQAPGRGGNGRGCQVAEVWLIRK